MDKPFFEEIPGAEEFKPKINEKDVADHAHYWNAEKPDNQTREQRLQQVDFFLSYLQRKLAEVRLEITRLQGKLDTSLANDLIVTPGLQEKINDLRQKHSELKNQKKSLENERKSLTLISS